MLFTIYSFWRLFLRKGRAYYVSAFHSEFKTAVIIKGI